MFNNLNKKFVILTIFSGLLIFLSTLLLTQFRLADANESISTTPPTETIISVPVKEYDYYVKLFEHANNVDVIEKTENEGQVTIANQKLTLIKSLSQVKVEEVQDQIKAYLGENESLYAIYVYDFNRNIEIVHRADELRPPASISKVPVAMLLLKDVQDGKIDLNSKLTISPYYGSIPSNILGTTHIGQDFSVRELLHWMIVDSDNVALTLLEDLLGGTAVINQRTINELGVNPFFRLPHDATAKNIGMVFRRIYDQSYLDKQHNDHLLNLLLSTAPSLQEELPVGLPQGTPIAHKTGRILMDGGGLAWQDAGIVYGEETDYVIVYLNQYVSEIDGKNNGQAISKIVYDALNK